MKPTLVMNTATALRANAAICTNAMVRRKAAAVSMDPVVVSVKPKLIWSAQLALVALCALALKFLYSTATARKSAANRSWSGCWLVGC